MTQKLVKEKQVEHIWSILCSNSTLDKDSNNLSLFNLIEQLNVNTKEDLKSGKAFNIPIALEFVSRFKKNIVGALNLEVELKIIDPESKTIGTFTKEIDFRKELRNFRLRNRFEGFRVTVPGTYYFEIGIRDKKTDPFTVVCRSPLEVKFTTSPKLPGA